MRLKLVHPPENSPVGLDEAKAHLRVLTDAEDDYILSLIDAAVDKAQQITNRQLSEATWELYDDAVPGEVAIPKPPLVAVEFVRAMRDGAYADIDYELDAVAEPAILRIDDTSCDDTANAFVVRFRSGYGECPAAIKQWILVQVATMYEQRETYQSGTIVSKMPRTFVDHLLDSYRVRIV